ncbi:hypothetical protein ACHAXS_009007 [Conticribra weissflogii]
MNFFGFGRRDTANATSSTLPSLASSVDEHTSSPPAKLPPKNDNDGSDSNFMGWGAGDSESDDDCDETNLPAYDPNYFLDGDPNDEDGGGSRLATPRRRHDLSELDGSYVQKVLEPIDEASEVSSCTRRPSMDSVVSGVSRESKVSKATRAKVVGHASEENEGTDENNVKSASSPLSAKNEVISMAGDDSIVGDDDASEVDALEIPQKLDATRDAGNKTTNCNHPKTPANLSQDEMDKLESGPKKTASDEKRDVSNTPLSAMEVGNIENGSDHDSHSECSSLNSETLNNLVEERKSIESVNDLILSDSFDGPSVVASAEPSVDTNNDANSKDGIVLEGNSAIKRGNARTTDKDVNAYSIGSASVDITVTSLDFAMADMDIDDALNMMDAEEEAIRHERDNNHVVSEANGEGDMSLDDGIVESVEEIDNRCRDDNDSVCVDEENLKRENNADVAAAESPNLTPTNKGNFALDVELFEKYSAEEEQEIINTQTQKGDPKIEEKTTPSEINENEKKSVDTFRGWNDCDASVDGSVDQSIVNSVSGASCGGVSIGHQRTKHKKGLRKNRKNKRVNKKKSDNSSVVSEATSVAESALSLNYGQGGQVMGEFVSRGSFVRESSIPDVAAQDDMEYDARKPWRKPPPAAAIKVEKINQERKGSDFSMGSGVGGFNGPRKGDFEGSAGLGDSIFHSSFYALMSEENHHVSAHDINNMVAKGIEMRQASNIESANDSCSESENVTIGSKSNKTPRSKRKSNHNGCKGDKKKHNYGGGSVISDVSRDDDDSSELTELRVAQEALLNATAAASDTASEVDSEYQDVPKFGSGMTFDGDDGIGLGTDEELAKLFGTSLRNSFKSGLIPVNEVDEMIDIDTPKHDNSQLQSTKNGSPNSSANANLQSHMSSGISIPILDKKDVDDDEEFNESDTYDDLDEEVGIANAKPPTINFGDRDDEMERDFKTKRISHLSFGPKSIIKDMAALGELGELKEEDEDDDERDENFNENGELVAGMHFLLEDSPIDGSNRVGGDDDSTVDGSRRTKSSGGKSLRNSFKVASQRFKGLSRMNSNGDDESGGKGAGLRRVSFLEVG